MYRITQTPDGFGGTIEGLSLQVLAPTYATINPVSGNRVDIAGLQPINYEYEIFVNKTDEFAWLPNMVIVSTIYGALQVASIREDNLRGNNRGQNLSREKLISLTANKMAQDIWQALLPSA